MECGSAPVMGAALATCLKVACYHGQSGVVLCLEGFDTRQGASWALVELLHAVRAAESLQEGLEGAAFWQCPK